MNQRQEHDVLTNSCGQCTACPLHSDVTKVSPVVSDGTIYPDLLVVGEAPGFYENLYNKPFVGKSGQLLREAISASGARQVYYTNLLKCRPDNNANPTDEQVESCAHWLDRELLLTKPPVVLAVGAFSSKYLLTNNRFGINIKNFKISTHRGNIYESTLDAKIIPTWHPAYVLRNKNAAYDLWEDIQLAFSLTAT